MTKISRSVIATAVACTFSAVACAQTAIRPPDAAGNRQPMALTLNMDQSEIKPQAKTEPTVAGTAALELAKTHNCFTCHAIDRKVVGPAWKDVSAKYRGDANAEESLVKKVAHGGKGVWGKDMVMPPFAPHMNETDIRTLVKYVLSLR